VILEHSKKSILVPNASKSWRGTRENDQDRQTYRANWKIYCAN
jgi:hypothetical protein